jgi:hypothetical protein
MTFSNFFWYVWWYSQLLGITTAFFLQMDLLFIRQILLLLLSPFLLILYVSLHSVCLFQCLLCLFNTSLIRLSTSDSAVSTFHYRNHVWCSQLGILQKLFFCDRSKECFCKLLSQPREMWPTDEHYYHSPSNYCGVMKLRDWS